MNDGVLLGEMRWLCVFMAFSHYLWVYGYGKGGQM